MASKDNNEDDASARARKAVKFNERFNVPEQTEEEEAESLADDREIERRKQH